MIRKLTVENFKCFGGKHEAPLGKLTLIFGQNNSGKSTLLQSLLLLRQSLESPGFAAGLNLAGPLYDAGSFSDVIHNHEEASHLSFGLGLDTDGDSLAQVEAQFVSDEPRPPRLSMFSIRQKEPRRAVKISRGRGRGGPFLLKLDSASVGNQETANFSFRAGSFLPVLGDEPPRRGRPSGSRAECRTWANEVTAQLSQLLMNMRALGPFRSPPMRRYGFSGGAREAIDFLGRQVIDSLVQDKIGKPKRDASALLGEINPWLERLARVKLELAELSTTQKLWEVRVRDTDSGRFANFADVGFGVGQALPVLVEGKRTPVGGVFIVQEPEIHLHPDAQLAMGDFLLELAKSGRQVIVETHSEHILLRVRRRLTQAARGMLPANDVSILHVGWDADHRSSNIVPLTIDQLGQVKKWPKGFFEEANDERLALLESMASRASRGGR